MVILFLVNVNNITEVLCANEYNAQKCTKEELNMAFCTSCGRPLQDGEICNCQNNNGFNNNGFNNSGYNNGFNNNVNFDVKSETRGIVDSAKLIIADPKNGVSRFIAGTSKASMMVLAALYAIIVVLSNVLYKVQSNIKYDLYETGEIIKGIFTDTLSALSDIAITAVVFYFVIKILTKCNVTWKQAFAIAVVDLMIMIPLLFVTEVLDLIPDFKLLSWVISAIVSVRSWGSTILTYLGLKSVCGDTRSTIYVSVPAMAVISIISSLINFLIYSIL